MKDFYFKLFILLFFSIPFLPSLGSYDIVATQWLYLSVINFLCFFFLLFSTKSNDLFTLVKAPHFKIYLVFIFFCILSLSFSNYINYSIQDLSRILNVFFSFILFTYLLKKIQKPVVYLFYIIVISLFFEVVLSLYPMAIFLLNNNIFEVSINSFDSLAFKGVAANPNITAASIVCKLPFLFYFLSRKYFFNKIIVFLISFLSFLALYFLSSRAAFLSLGLQLIALSIFFLLNESDIKIKIQKLLLFLTPFILSYYVTVGVFRDINSVTSQVSTINFSNESSSNRFLLWQHALDYIGKHPFGSGLGNWKIESAPYWKSMGSGYLVPFHAHNDFLEITTEIGIFGGISFISIFLVIYYSSLVSFFRERSYYIFILFVALNSYIIDSALNFPLERVIMQLIFVSLISLSLVFYKNNSNA